MDSESFSKAILTRAIFFVEKGEGVGVAVMFLLNSVQDRVFLVVVLIFYSQDSRNGMGIQ